MPLAAELEEMRQIFCQPLVEVLRAGHDSGILRSPTPEADAYSLFTLVSAVANGGDSQFLSRSEAKAHVMRFSWPAFGLPLEIDPSAVPTGTGSDGLEARDGQALA